MSKYAGFDTDRVGRLASAVAEAARAASSLAGKVGSTSSQGRHYAMLAAGVAPQAIRAEEAGGGAVGPTYALDTVASAAPAVADEIGRRLRHLVACEKLADAGFSVNVATVFDDALPPDPAKVRKALADIRSGLRDPISGAAGLDRALSGLDPAEAEAVVAALGDGELDALNAVLDLQAKLPGVGPALRTTLSNVLFPGLDAAQVHRISEHLGVLQPPFSGTEGEDHDDQKDLHWRWVDGELVPGGTSPGQINQGDLGDCWFLAGLGAEVQNDPNFVQHHVRDNGNGTYSVTFYQDGTPVVVTVDSALPYNSLDQSAFAHDPGGGKWVEIYEKAYAQLKGSYADIEGGFGDQSLEDLTGRSASKHDDDDYSLSDLQQLLAAGRPITAGSNDHHRGFLWLHEDTTFPGTQVVTKHEYIVEKVEDGQVVLRNPWGSGSSVDEEITLSEEEFHHYFGEVSVGG